MASLGCPGRNLRDVGLTARRSLTNISIGVPSNINETEKRVALVPDDVAKLIKLGATVTYVHDLRACTMFASLTCRTNELILL